LAKLSGLRVHFFRPRRESGLFHYWLPAGVWVVFMKSCRTPGIAPVDPRGQASIHFLLGALGNPVLEQHGQDQEQHEQENEQARRRGFVS
jgi:hypothetical protein